MMALLERQIDSRSSISDESCYWTSKGSLFVKLFLRPDLSSCHQCLQSKLINSIFECCTQLLRFLNILRNLKFTAFLLGVGLLCDVICVARSLATLRHVFTLNRYFLSEIWAHNRLICEITLSDS